MIEFERDEDVPHLYVRCSGRISFDDMVERAPALERALERLRPGAVIACEAAAVEVIEPEAVGVLCYLLLCAFRGAPATIVATRSSATDAVCAFAQRVDANRRIRIVEDPAAFTAAVARLAGE